MKVKYSVSLVQVGEDVLCTLFNCEATDEADARRQAHEAYPGCRVLTIYAW